MQVRRSILGPFRVVGTNCLLSLVQDVYVSIKDNDQDQYSAGNHSGRRSRDCKRVWRKAEEFTWELEAELAVGLPGAFPLSGCK